MEFYKIYKSFIINEKTKNCNTNNNNIKEFFKNNGDKKINENNKSTTIIKTNLGAVFK
jgi:hypothetical protein